MKIKNSITKQFTLTMFSFMILLVIGIGTLLGYSYYSQQQELEIQTNLETKEDIAIAIDKNFANAFFNMRGYIAYNNEDFLLKVSKDQQKLEDQINKLRTISQSQDDTFFYNEVASFYDYYFLEKVPEIRENIESNQQDQVIQDAQQVLTNRIEAFQQTTSNYRSAIDQQIFSHYGEVTQKNIYLQLMLLIFIVIMLFVLFFITKYIISRFVVPLRRLTEASELVSAGSMINTETFQLDREDELGVLAVSLDKMVKHIQQNEEYLTDKNEELMEQQDELQAQALELEKLLGQMETNERKLLSRQQLNESLANTLNKQLLTESIVKGFVHVTQADRGMIVLLDEELTHSSWGVSSSAANEFKESIYSGLHEHLLLEKETVCIKRALVGSEKGIHDETQICYDAYIPVLQGDGKVIAIMIYSRFSKGFMEEELRELEELAKQISVSIQNIDLYESTEEEKQLNKDILNTIHEGVLVLDTNGNIVSSNNKMYELFNLSKPQLPTSKIELSNWLEFFHAKIKDREEMNEFIHAILEQKATLNSSIVYQIEDELLKTVQMYWEPLFRKEQLTGFILVHRDITTEYNADKMKSELVSTVSHELRTPLASILGFTELLLKKTLSPERQQKYLNNIYQESKRLTALINDFLDLQRMESNKQDYFREKLKIYPLLKEVLEELSVHSSNHQLKLEVKDTEVEMYGDKDKLKQLFQNIIQNAIKYSPHGGEVITRVDLNEDNLIIKVVDFGLGIPREAIPQLFTKFYRVDNTDRRKIGGTGLGLSISKEIVRAHQGQISVESELGIGTTFIIQLPKTETPKIIKEQGSKKSGIIYLIEDDSALANAISSELGLNGFWVVVDSVGEHAVKHMKESQPDIIVLDLMLQHAAISGWDILMEIKQDPILSSIPIIISSSLDEKARARELGVHQYFLKPYLPSELTATIKSSLLNENKRSSHLS
ncbi:ATP-binding protein [Mangrovibacillus cuniculi]|uniref:histidine kinase n=1 Tax=Mangrovibacillus cuniculi TaxID=2593652 RepID=A0A7S8CAL2_9BACI|nr:ATP-binding protein [Mangrovibacillus cuniculi]QPC46472.1 response regulator [Mangrovibacillus cuniculi]